MKKIIKIGAEWCGPCKALEPIFQKISRMDEFKDAEFKSIDAEDDEALELVDKFQVRNVPTILVLNDNNELIDKMIGAAPESRLIQFLRETLSK